MTSSLSICPCLPFDYSRHQTTVCTTLSRQLAVSAHLACSLPVLSFYPVLPLSNWSQTCSFLPWIDSFLATITSISHWVMLTMRSLTSFWLLLKLSILAYSSSIVLAYWLVILICFPRLSYPLYPQIYSCRVSLPLFLSAIPRSCYWETHCPLWLLQARSPHTWDSAWVPQSLPLPPCLAVCSALLEPVLDGQVRSHGSVFCSLGRT